MKLNALYELSSELNVLYIEDHDETREVLHDLLETIFPTVLVATNGEEGLEKYKNNEIDLIITDINMPKMDGITMIEQIREEDKEIKIVVFSAHEKTEYLTRCIELDVDGFLTKPLNQNKYFQTLYKVVEQIHTKKELNKYKNELEQKVQEQLDELIEKNEMIQKNARLATMGEMIDAIAHQWKSPLSVIKLHIDLITMKTEAGILDTSEVETSMGKMLHQLDHLFETIEEFRKFFRPNTNLELVKVKSLVDSTLLLLKDELIRHTINVECEYEKDDYMVRVNQSEFKHVLINLIQNSKDAFVQNGIKPREIKIKIFQKEEQIGIELCDNAGGVPSEVLDEIFSAHVTTKESTGGTGIGLYLVKQILDKVNAKIEVRNSELGACFTISI